MFEIDDRFISRIIGISTAAAILVTVSIMHGVINIKTATVEKSGVITAESAEDTHSVSGTVIMPFKEDDDDNGIPGEFPKKDSGKLREVYNELVSSENERLTQKQETEDTDVTLSTSVTTAAPEETTQIITSTTTSAPSKTTASTAPSSEPSQEAAVSNGKREFNYDDVTAIAANLHTLEDFVSAVHPTSFCWDTTNYARHGCVRISLISAGGSVTLDVKPLAVEPAVENYLIGGEISGSMNASSLEDLEWYRLNAASGCNICSVTWISQEFGIEPVRGIHVGTGLADVVGQYLCINGGATTLYKASDVIKNQSKLNALLACENVYTFVGGRVYTIDSYLQKYYAEKEHSYRFADCGQVVQYGCNSVMEFNYTTGSWIIEYAIKNDTVEGITFMNKSYYESEGQTMSATTATTAASVSNTDTASTTTATSATSPLSATASLTAANAAENGVTQASVAESPSEAAETTAETKNENQDQP